MDVEKADAKSGIQQLITPMRSTNMVGKNPYIMYKGIDLTDVKSFEIGASAQARTSAAGGVVEIRIDSPNGAVIGKTNMIEVSNGGFGGPAPAPNPNQKGASLGTPVAASAPAAPGAAGAPAGAAPAGGAPRRMGPSSQTVAIQETKGAHDLYFVAVNPAAGEQQIVVQISSIEAKN